MKHFLKQSLRALALSSIAFSSIAAERSPHEVKDLRYGEALYHFYQEQYFTSITNLLVAKERRPIDSQNIDPELLLGGLYLYYGLHQNASNIFGKLIETNTSEETQDLAWFNIGKMRYQEHLFPDAKQALIKIKDTLSSERAAEKQNMLANTYLKEKDFVAARDAIKKLDSNEDWLIYAQYNMGIALIKSGTGREGTDLLNSISSLKTDDEELKALRDKTNIALGYAFIRQKRPDVSVKYLQKVRLKGPLSAKALLGIGWAYQQQNKLEQALVPWMELRDWPVIDTAVQESLLAVPYTLEKMQKNQLALKHYNYAIDNYKTELVRLKSTLNAVKGGELLFALRPAMVTENILDTQYKKQLPESISAPYMHHLLNSVDFQNIHRNYLDLIYIKKNLKKWKQQFSAYNLMLKERAAYYAKQLKVTRNDARLNKIKRLKQQRDKLTLKVNNIKQQQQIEDIATEDEIDILNSLKKVGSSLKHLSKKDDYSEEQEKYKLYKGLMLWEIATDYTPRYWKIRNELNLVNKALSKTEKQLQSLVLSSKKAPLSFSGYKQRIKDKEKTLNRLIKKVNTIIRSQEKSIEQKAIASLQQRYHQIENYHTRANYSLARLYDRLTLPSNIRNEEKNKGDDK
ncbi:MAG: hypothetical protein QM484_06805 [Woeseiaceae bacterium]